MSNTRLRILVKVIAVDFIQHLNCWIISGISVDGLWLDLTMINAIAARFDERFVNDTHK